VRAVKIVVRILVVGLMALVAGCGDARHYELVGQRARHTYLVYVPPRYADDQSVYEQAIRDISRNSPERSIVMFWNDRSKVWRDEQPEMTQQQAAARVAGYHRDAEHRLNNFYWLRDGSRVDVGPVE
jgi:hypothetical protein